MITFTILFPLSLLRYCSWGTVCLMLYLCFVSLYYYRKRKSKLFVLAENWHIEYLEDANFYSDISFSQFSTLNPFLGKFKPKKVKIITFIITFMIFFPPQSLTLLRFEAPCTVCCIYVLRACNITEKKVKDVRFAWKLAYRVSRGCWFLFRNWFSEFPILNPFLGKFGLKKPKLFVLLENWHTHTHTHTEYPEDADSYFDISFLKFQT